MWRRKLQEQGKVSLAISLPKEWTRDFNLNKGDELVLNRDTHGNLIINSSKEIKDTKKTIEILDGLDSLRREILSYYLHGVKEIIITSKAKIDSLQRVKIKEAVFDKVDGTQYNPSLHVSNLVITRFREEKKMDPWRASIIERKAAFIGEEELVAPKTEKGKEKEVYE